MAGDGVGTEAECDFDWLWWLRRVSPFDLHRPLRGIALIGNDCLGARRDLFRKNGIAHPHFLHWLIADPDADSARESAELRRPIINVLLRTSDALSFLIARTGVAHEDIVFDYNVVPSSCFLIPYSRMPLRWNGYPPTITHFKETWLGVSTAIYPLILQPDRHDVPRELKRVGTLDD